MEIFRQGRGQTLARRRLFGVQYYKKTKFRENSNVFEGFENKKNKFLKEERYGTNDTCRLLREGQCIS